ncbi:hypothetical protein BH23ACT2_BH23ACT2_26970 [soil metagenome]
MAAHRPVHVVGLLGGRPVGADALAALTSASRVIGGADQLRSVNDLLAEGAETFELAGGLGALDALDEEALDDTARGDRSHGDTTLDDPTLGDPASDIGGPRCVLASGDPGFCGIVRTLTARLPHVPLAIHPAPSSVSMAFARLGLAWDRAVVASCHAGDASRAAAEVAGAPVAAVLCGPSAPPEALGRALGVLGAHHRLVAVASRLAEPNERVTRLGSIDELAAGSFDHRSVVVLAHPDPSPVAPRGRTGGRPIDAFVHRAGMITKPEVRSMVLGRLDLPDHGVLWDVGAGSGSVAVEAALAAPGLRVVAVERDPDAAAAITANAVLAGALVEVVTGAAPEALGALPAPHRVFVGGGGLAVLDAAIDAARPGARVVASYAALDRALTARDRLGSLVQVSVDVARDLPDGGVRFVADNPVFVAWGDVRAGVETGVEASEGAPRPRVVLGVGCSSPATADEVVAVGDQALLALDEALGGDDRKGSDLLVATIDRRASHPAIAPLGAERTLLGFPAALLRAVDTPNPSAAVDEAVGTPSVAEAAALLAAGPRARLVVTKRTGATATAAVAIAAAGPARATDDPEPGMVRVVGLGPGGAGHRTPAATTAVRSADAVVGYGPYVDAAGPLLRPEQLVVRAEMGQEADRAEAAVALARAGWSVAVVSSGDPGTFAMASVTLEVAAVHSVAVEIVPGVTAASTAAAIAGAPLAGPYAALTLSDILTRGAIIEAQLRAAAGAGCAIALYNPRSAGRPDHLSRARHILAEHLDGTTPVVVVTDATGPRQELHVTTLADLDPAAVGMRSIVLVGTSATEVLGGRVVTRRHHPRTTEAATP